jgi:acetate kinase
LAVALKQSAKHKDAGILTVFFAQTSIDRIQKELEEKKNLTQNSIMSFKPLKRVKIYNMDYLVKKHQTDGIIFTKLS